MPNMFLCRPITYWIRLFYVRLFARCIPVAHIRLQQVSTKFGVWHPHPEDGHGGSILFARWHP